MNKSRELTQTIGRLEDEIQNEELELSEMELRVKESEIKVT